MAKTEFVQIILDWLDTSDLSQAQVLGPAGIPEMPSRPMCWVVFCHIIGGGEQSMMTIGMSWLCVCCRMALLAVSRIGATVMVDNLVSDGTWDNYIVWSLYAGILTVVIHFGSVAFHLRMAMKYFLDAVGSAVVFTTYMALSNVSGHVLGKTNHSRRPPRNMR